MKLKKNDLVKIISGDHKGKTGKIVGIFPSDNTVQVEGIGNITRKLKPSQLNPQGGTKEIHRPINASKVALVHPTDDKKTTRIGFALKKDGTKVRVARQASNKEIK